MSAQEIIRTLTGSTLDGIVTSCLHCPHHDPSAVGFVLDYIKEHQPRVFVFVGDLIEAIAASKWDADVMLNLQDEYDSAGRVLEQIRKQMWAYAPEEPILVILSGNHDRNILTRGRLDQRIHSLIDIAKHVPELDYWHRECTDYNRCRRRGVFRIGQIGFAHGWASGDSGVKHEVLEMINEYGLYIHGHTHRAHAPKPVQRTQSHALRYYYANTGCLRDLDPEYMERKDKSRWSHGLVHFRVPVIKSPRSSYTWEAQTVIHQTYDEWQNPDTPGLVRPRALFG